MTTNIKELAKLIFPKESYVITGVLFSVQNELGRFAREKQYGDKIVERFSEKYVPFQREVHLSNSGNVVDFIVFDKIILELKAKRFLVQLDFDQVQRYLQESQLSLGILVNFREMKLRPRRVVKYSEEKFHS